MAPHLRWPRGPSSSARPGRSASSAGGGRDGGPVGQRVAGRPLPDPGEDRQRRHLDGVPRSRHPARPSRRREGDGFSLRGRRAVPHPLPARGPHRRTPEGSRAGRGLRPGLRRSASVSGDGAHRGRHPARAAGRARTHAALRRGGGASSGARRVGCRAPRRSGASRRQAGERVDLRRRRGEDRRLRVGPRRRRRRNHLYQCDFGHRGVSVARAGARRRREPAQRRVLRGHPRL